MMAWHPEITAPKLFKQDMSKPIRKLSERPRWAERLNKRQQVLAKEGKLPAATNSGETVEDNIDG